MSLPRIFLVRTVELVTSSMMLGPACIDRMYFISCVVGCDNHMLSNAVAVYMYDCMTVYACLGPVSCGKTWS